MNADALKDLDFKSIIEMIVEFIKTILKFEFNFDLGASEEETQPEA